MIGDIEIVLTEHAKERMTAKGVDNEQIKRAIMYGAKQKQTGGFLASYTYIEVAYKIIKNKYIIKTVKIK